MSRYPLSCINRFGIAALMVAASNAIAQHETSPAADTHCPAQQDAERQVEATLKRVQDGLRTRDSQLLSSPESYFYDDGSPDHYVLFDVMPPSVDVGAKTLLEKNTRMLAARDGPTLVYWTDKFVGADCTGAEGSYAYFRGILHSNIHYRDGRSFDATIRHTYVLKKIRGKYLIVHEHGSVPYSSMSIDTDSPAPGATNQR